MCPGPGVLLGWEEEQGNKKRGPGRTVGADLVADGFFADSPPLWVVPGAAALFKGG